MFRPKYSNLKVSSEEWPFGMGLSNNSCKYVEAAEITRSRINNARTFKGGRKGRRKGKKDTREGRREERRQVGRGRKERIVNNLTSQYNADVDSPVFKMSRETSMGS